MKRELQGRYDILKLSGEEVSEKMQQIFINKKYIDILNEGIE